MNQSTQQGLASRWVNRSSFWFYLLLFLFALLPRLLHLFSIADNPFFDFPIIDSKTYDDLAQKIAGGDWIGRKVFWQAPLYPYFLATVYFLFGHDLFLARLIQILIGSANCLLLYQVAKTAFNPRIGMIAFLIAVFYAPFMFFEAELLNPVLIIVFNLTLVLVLFSFLDHPKKIKLFSAGIILGLSSITHGLTMTFLPFVILWVIIIHIRSKLSAIKIVNFCLTLVTGFLLVLSFTLVRNLIVGKDLVLISSNSGINFFIGNNPDYEKTTSIRPGIKWEELVQRPLQRGLHKPSERSNFFWGEAFSFIKGRPFSYVKLLFRKLLLILDGYEIKRNQDLYLFRDFSFPLKFLLWRWVIYFPFGLLLPLSLAGIIFFFQDRSKSKGKDPKPILILYFLLSQTVALLFFFICARYRLPLVSFLIIFAGFALCWWHEKLRAKKLKEVFVSLLIFLIFCFLSNMRQHEPTSKDEAEEHYNLGLVYQRAGKFERAKEEYNQALRLQPDHLMAFYHLGLLYQKENKMDEAQEMYRRVIDLFPRAALAYNNLGLIHQTKGEVSKAEESYLKASDYHRLWPDPLYNLGRLYEDQGRYQEAEEKFQACIEVDPEYYKAYNDLGELYYRGGRIDQAIILFRETLKLRPDYELAHNNLGTAYIKKGLRQKAFLEFEKAISINPDYGSAHLNLGNWYLEAGNLGKAIGAYHRAKSLMPCDPRVCYYLAVAYMMSNLKEEAVKELNEALSADSSFAPAKKLLEKIIQP